MSSRSHAPVTRHSRRDRQPPSWRPTPLSQAVAALLIAGGAAGAAQAQSRAFSPGWFADKGATQSAVQRSGRLPDGSLAGIGNATQQQAQSRQQLQRSLDNLNRTAAAVAAQQAAQAAARAAASANGAGVPDGLTPGGLWAAEGAQAKWEGAKAPQKSAADGRQVVTIEQTQSRAILNWDTFNVGRDTTLQFKQGAADAVLNRVVGASARPSEIHGAIKADGTVLVVNQNGVIFSGTSQVNARNLVAAAATITDQQFRDKGIHADAEGTQPTFKDAVGKIELRPGASIATHEPGSATRGGGYVLLLGREVHNAGQIATPRGQAALAAGDDFYIRKGYGTDGNVKSTTTGNEVGVTVKAGSAAGLVRNSGLISAATGDITLAGRQVRQDGVLVASTDIGARGAIHLLNRASDASGSVALGEGSVTAVVLESSALTGLDGQRDAALKALDGQATNKTGGAYDHLSTVADRRDLSRIEVVTGGQALFAGGSTTVATGGQIAVSAGKQALVDAGARLDVAGAIGVKVAMESNSVRIDVQGNEQRDSPVNRDSKNLNNSEVWVDRRTLVKVAAGVNGYQNERWYTAGGLLEVGGYLATSGRGAGEWLAQGGTATFTGGELVTRAGSDINLSGGTLDVRDGYIRQSWLRGADGRLYELSRAPGDLLYTGMYKGFEQKHERWGERATRTFYNPLIAPRQRYESGYTVGRDAGRLVVSASSARLEGGMTGETYLGPRQTDAPQAALDGFLQPQHAAARRGELVVGSYLPRYDEAGKTLAWGLTGVAGKITVGEGEAGAGEIRLSAAWLNQAGLGGLRLAAVDTVAVNDALRLAPGGEAVMYAPWVDIKAGISAPGGAIQAGNVLRQLTPSGRVEDSVTLPRGSGRAVGVQVAAGATLDVGGLWANLGARPQDHALLPYGNGGLVSLRSSGNIKLEAGSGVILDGGAAVLAGGKRRAGKGGDAVFEAGAGPAVAVGALDLSGAISALGADGGGTLRIQGERVRIQSARAARLDQDATWTLLRDDLFSLGFARYEITGKRELEVAESAAVRVVMPMLRYADQAASALDKAGALQAWMPPLYQDDAVKAELTQRKGAGLSLAAGVQASSLATARVTVLNVARGALLEVDPGQSLRLGSVGQLTVDGILRAPGGSIVLGEIKTNADVDAALIAAGHGRSIWLGDAAVLDAAARAVTAIDARGRRYGWVNDGGRIVVGGEIDHQASESKAANLFVVLRAGARLDASGAEAVLDLGPGGAPLRVASHGGSIALASGNGLRLDGRLIARAGGAGAAGGSLSVALEAPLYQDALATRRVLGPRELVLRQTHAPYAWQADATPESAAAGLNYGEGSLGMDRVAAGGFGSLALLSQGMISFDGSVSLAMAQSLSLYSASMGLSENAPRDARIDLAAPYLRLAGAVVRGKDWHTAPVVRVGVSARATDATLRLSGQMIDVRDEVRMNVNGSVTLRPLASIAVERRGFREVVLDSAGDLRFERGVNTPTLLETSGNLLLRAAQLYPATHAIATVRAGYNGGSAAVSHKPDGLLAIQSTGGAPAMPYSVFGSLSLSAGRIEQGGVLRAPLGTIALGYLNGAASATEQISLLPGSITSASAAGLVMPYGGTVDGVTWTHQGAAVELEGVVSSTRGVTLSGRRIESMPGALLDLRGGGELRGAGFVSGRGGSTDARMAPLMQVGAQGGFTLPSLATNPVYAIVPGVQPGYAPSGGERGASTPTAGQRVTLAQGVPGLPAGTYTLLPSTYALLPGAFRVEINGGAARAVGQDRAIAMRNGSWSAPGALSVPDAGVADALPRQLILTPADTLRKLSQYNETSYAAFVRADALRLGVPRASLPQDGRNLSLLFTPGAGEQALRFRGEVDFRAAEGGFAGSVAVLDRGGIGQIEILAPDGVATPGFNGVALRAQDLNALSAARLALGARPEVSYGQSGNFFKFVGGDSNGSRGITLRAGAQLSAAEVLMVVGSPFGQGITIEAGAGISTLGRGKTPFDSRDGFVYQPGYMDQSNSGSMLAVSNGWLDVLPMAASARGPQPILVGVCGAAGCEGQTQLYAEGTLVFATNKRFELDNRVRFGARNLSLSVGALNVGDAPTLAAVQAAGKLVSGLTLNQDVLGRLLRGDTARGAPALENLILNAYDSINFYGGAALDTRDPATGRSSLKNLVIGTPAIYGYGGAGDVAAIRSPRVVWTGSAAAPASVVAGGAGTGAGTLAIEAEEIVLGYGAQAQPDGLRRDGRLALGFSSVVLDASRRLTANQRGSLSVYRSQDGYESGVGYRYSGGDLLIRTPVLTGEAGSVIRMTAGGALRVTASDGAAPSTASGLGAELGLKGASVFVDTQLVAPSGRIRIEADGDIVLGARSRLEAGGRGAAFGELTRYSWGGDVLLDSARGNILQAEGGVIDVSARFNQAGSLTARAVDPAAGRVDLRGTLLGAASGWTDAGGTLVPFRAGAIDIAAQRLGDGTPSEAFAALNARLNTAGMYGGRSFQLKQGDLVIGDGLKAGEINVSLDAGSLTVAGRIDASGIEVGAIRLAARHGLTIGGQAVLDAHGTGLRVDGRGQIIDSPNRAIVELSATDGLLTLASGARVDLRHGTDAPAGRLDGRARGTLTLNAPRTGQTSGDMLIDASGALDIQGARAIVVNAMYRDAVLLDGNDAAGGKPYKYVDQDYLNQRHADSERFMQAALANPALLRGRLAGLNNARYLDALHLRPGLELYAAGDLVVRGDLDLSGHRYDSIDPARSRTALIGSGESGFLTLRAGGDLHVYGSINDGFAPPPVTPDDDGWVLKPGALSFGGDMVLPVGGVKLADGSIFPPQRTLNYDLPVKDFSVDAGQRLPVAVTLAAPLTIPANTVLGGPVLAADGALLYAAGTLLGEAVTLPANARLGAGFVTPAQTAAKAMLWPAGAPLAARMTLNGELTLKMGALLPSMTNVRLPGDPMVLPLRPADGQGNMGRNWAVASMLPAGSESWSLRAVAGADPTAADSRIARARDGAGNLILADSHYTVYDKHEIFVTPGTPGGPLGLWYCNDVCMLTFGGSHPELKLGQPVSDAVAAQCNDGVCDKVRYLWTEMGKEWYDGMLDEPVVVGAPVPKVWEDLVCVDAGICVPQGQMLPGTPPVETIGRLLDRQIASPAFSVLRTGAGDLELVAGGDLRMKSPFGVYTAGTQAAGVDAAFQRARAVSAEDGKVLDKRSQDYEKLVAGDDRTYRAWYPEGGGNLLVRAGRDLAGDSWSNGSYAGEGQRMTQMPNTDPSNWLWRQADASSSAWWINFGTYIRGADAPYLVGFTGFGTLGGGDLRVDVGGDAGAVTRVGNPITEWINGESPRSQGLVLAVGATGRARADGSLLQTGGGDMDVRIGGGLNPTQSAYMGLNAGRYENSHMALNGLAANLRGRADIRAGVQGTIERRYGPFAVMQDLKEIRAYDAYASTMALAGGGLALMPGDAVFNLEARGDLVLGTVRDPGRLTPLDYLQAGEGWFSLWTPSSAIRMYSAGGNLTPGSQLADSNWNGLTPTAGLTGIHFTYPSIFTATAPSGSIYMGPSAARGLDRALGYSMLLAPSPNSALELLAGGSIYASGYAVNRSGADLSALATPFAPGLSGVRAPGALGLPLDLLANGSYTVVGAGPETPAQIRAAQGDIVGLRVGERFEFTSGRMGGQSWYLNAGAVRMMAGRDIVNSGTSYDGPLLVPGMFGADTMANSMGNLFTHGSDHDVSIVSAGRDIVRSNFIVAGPGVLEVEAGRHLRAEDKGSLISLGPVVAGDTRPGAAIALTAGAGAAGPDYRALLDYYLGGAADPSRPLTDQGKPFKTYEAELLLWLIQRHGYAGAAEDAPAYLAALPPEQQRIFARQVYFAELRAGGREYNARDSARQGSYLRGRQAIAALFPERGPDGAARVYDGDITLYGGTGLRSIVGGDIQVLSPGGQQVYGVEGAAPPASAGVVTQGAGEISLYARRSILLGQSRIMTTFGGGILAWSAEGDINAGRGAKTTVVYTPPRRVYDTVGNVALSPNAPSSGAGIATLAPIAEVPAGDVDLYAPLGTIDAGEAGIRVSGNINIAALHVVNAANIQVKGESNGIPVTATVNTGALASASAASSAAVGAAQESVQRAQQQSRQNLPSVISVQILGYGDEPAAAAPSAQPRAPAPAYRPDGVVQVQGVDGGS